MKKQSLLADGRRRFTDTPEYRAACERVRDEVRERFAPRFRGAGWWRHLRLSLLQWWITRRELREISRDRALFVRRRGASFESEETR